ncbi:MAG: hypothetical protein HQK49_15030, partial [Oligoflexia bacterium]|nr:hypothetical protein [Oligoflexia bacterium]
AEKELDRLDNIDKLFKIIVNKRDKAPDEKVSDIIKKVKSENSRMKIASEVLTFVELQETNGKLLVETTKSLLDWKKSIFENAKNLGLKLKDNLEMEKVDTIIEFMEENDKFCDSKDEIVKNHYEYYVVRNKNNGELFSNWISPNKRGFRPGSIWYPKLQSSTCRKFANKTKEKFVKTLADKEFVFDIKKEDDEGTEFYRADDARDVCIQRGLNDLLELCEQCQSIETLNNEANKIVNILAQKSGEPIDEEQLLSARKKLNKLKQAHAEIDRDAFNKIFKQKNIHATINEQNEIEKIGAVLK